MMIASKMWPLECEQVFPLIWPDDLVFDPKWPSIETDLDFIGANILGKFHQDWVKTVTFRVLTN